VLDRIVAAGTPAIRKTTFHYGTESVGVAIRERDGVDALYAPRRTVLDASLADAAREAGAHVLHDAVVERVELNALGRAVAVHVTDEAGISHRVPAGIIIGADGERSGVARAVGAEIVHAGHRPSACLYGYWRDLDTDGTHWYFNHDVAAGSTPTNHDETCVFVSMRPAAYHTRRGAGVETLFQNGLAETDPDLANLVSRGARNGKLHGYAGRPGVLRKPYGPGWALVGDAGCFKDPLTAHGITDALRDAELLARAVIAGTDAAFASYQATRDAFAAEFLDISDEVASFEWDLERAKALHRRMSTMMKEECGLVRSFDTFGTPRLVERIT
jgi:2-polyprenyl-6-methoxyphenol hydroxylase-like FAD-dependent oxidoreductase